MNWCVEDAGTTEEVIQKYRRWENTEQPTEVIKMAWFNAAVVFRSWNNTFLTRNTEVTEEQVWEEKSAWTNHVDTNHMLDQIWDQMEDQI